MVYDQADPGAGCRAPSRRGRSTLSRPALRAAACGERPRPATPGREPRNRPYPPYTALVVCCVAPPNSEHHPIQVGPQVVSGQAVAVKMLVEETATVSAERLHRRLIIKQGAAQLHEVAHVLPRVDDMRARDQRRIEHGRVRRADDAGSDRHVVDQTMAEGAISRQVDTDPGARDFPVEARPPTEGRAALIAERTLLLQQRYGSAACFSCVVDAEASRDF